MGRIGPDRVIVSGLFAVPGAGPVLSGGVVAGIMLVSGPLMGPGLAALVLL